MPDELLAVVEGHEDCVKPLLTAGAKTDVSTQDGRTALKLALDQGHNAIALILKGAGTQ